MEPTKEATFKQRNQQLHLLQTWCMARISRLSLEQANEDANALTAEHLELLQCSNPTTTLWMSIEQ